MIAQCIPNWDRLALAWDAFEERGVTARILEPYLSELELPVAVVGCGRGALLDHLQRRYPGESILGLDSSAEMIRLARERGHESVTLVSPESPIPLDSRPATILVATGVLDPLDPRELGALFSHFRERLPAGGGLIVSTFGRRSELEDLARVAGAEHPFGLEWGPMLDWALGHPGAAECAGVMRWLAAVASLRGSSLCGAVAWLKSALPFVRRQFHREELLRIFSRSGFEVLEMGEHRAEGVIVIRGRS